MPPKPKKRSSGSALAKKAKESGIPISILRQVKKRGDAAYLSSGSRNVPMAAWSMGRVNSFISGKGGARKADADLWKKAKPNLFNIFSVKSRTPMISSCSWGGKQNI